MARLALVTGGARGIGAAICKALKAAGYTVAVADFGSDETANNFTKETGIKVYKWDVSDPNQCTKGIEIVSNEFCANVDILVNNAGITRDGMMHKMLIENWDTVIKTNLSSAFYMSRTVISQMKKNAFGRIVSIASINGKMGQLGQTNYSAAKAGIIGFTKALALESARSGITVNAVAPGYTLTDMVKAIPKDVLKNIVAKIPVGRLGTPEEIAAAVLFLVSDSSGFITGETLSVNGGQYMD